jgi:hypothetical protein
MPDAIEAFLASYPPEMQAISRALRAMVTETMPPQAREVLYASHNHFAYSFSESMADRICYICPMKEYVRLGFMFGAHLPDPDQMLVGEGKRLRHVKVHTLEAANHPALKGLVEAAWTDASTQIKPKQRAKPATP